MDPTSSALSHPAVGLCATKKMLGMHIDDPRMDPILEKCAELRMPVNIHVGEDKWMYEPIFRNYHWPMHAWALPALPDKVLKKVYRANPLKLLSKPR
jgi:hypothetical protein